MNRRQIRSQLKRTRVLKHLSKGKRLAICQDNRSVDEDDQTTSCGSNEQKWNANGTRSRIVRLPFRTLRRPTPMMETAVVRMAIAPPCPTCQRTDRVEEEDQSGSSSRWFVCTRCGRRYTAPRP